MVGAKSSLHPNGKSRIDFVAVFCFGVNRRRYRQVALGLWRPLYVGDHGAALPPCCAKTVLRAANGCVVYVRPLNIYTRIKNWLHSLLVFLKQEPFRSQPFPSSVRYSTKSNQSANCKCSLAANVCYCAAILTRRLFVAELHKMVCGELGLHRSSRSLEV